MSGALREAKAALHAAEREDHARALAREMARSLKLAELLAHVIHVHDPDPVRGGKCADCEEARRVAEAYLDAG